MKKAISLVWRIPLTLFLLLLSIIVLSNLCPIYRFESGKAFEGAQIYNPYSEEGASFFGRGEDVSARIWTRANFHTHTRATRWINECELFADSVRTFYDLLGYDLVSFSNHMELTADPRGTDGQIWVYEHGYNFAKHHNLVFGPHKGVCYYDALLPVMSSQKQFKMDVLRRNADFIFFNHPDRTNFTDDRDMARLSGYRLLEADCGFDDWDTVCHKWDVALSNGHYVPSAISDDLHYPRNTARIGRRCSFLNTSSERYEDVRECLLKGDFYTAHIPDFGDGDWDVKIAANADLPSVVAIGLKDGVDTYMTLSQAASEIQAVGQGGEIVKSLRDTCAIDYAFTEADSYIRYVARFEDGTVLYSNPFARWDGETAAGVYGPATPYRDFAHPVNWLLTILYNLGVLLVGLLLLRGVKAVVCGLWKN